MGGTSARFHFFKNSVGGLVAHRTVVAIISTAVAVHKFFKSAVQQPATKFVAERIPHDGIHTDKAGRQMGYGKELDEFHIDQIRPGPER